MSVAALKAGENRAPAAPIAAETVTAPFNPRTNKLLNSPIVTTLLLLAWPNVLVTVA